MLRRSPRGRKGSEQQNDEDDVKIPNGAPLHGADRRASSSPAVNGSKDAGAGETTGKGRRGFNKDLLHNLRSRLTGKPLSSTPQRGTASQHSVRTAIPNPCASPSNASQYAPSKFDATASCGDTRVSVRLSQWLPCPARGRCEPSRAQAVPALSNVSVSSPPGASPRDHAHLPPTVPAPIVRAVPGNPQTTQPPGPLSSSSMASRRPVSHSTT